MTLCICRGNGGYLLRLPGPSSRLNVRKFPFLELSPIRVNDVRQGRSAVATAHRPSKRECGYFGESCAAATYAGTFQ